MTGLADHNDLSVCRKLRRAATDEFEGDMASAISVARVELEPSAYVNEHGSRVNNVDCLGGTNLREGCGIFAEKAAHADTPPQTESCTNQFDSSSAGVVYAAR